MRLELNDLHAVIKKSATVFNLFISKAFPLMSFAKKHWNDLQDKLLNLTVLLLLFQLDLKR